jgi:REP element-mobilizing transposase RayT
MSAKPPSNPDTAFGPIDPWRSEHLTINRRNLPHLAVPGATYFITFRAKAELSPTARDVVFANICACDQQTIDLEAAVVMADHVHLMFRLIHPYRLSQVLQRIKGRSARQINRLLRSQGSVWSDESFDHIIRRAEELEEKLEYVRQNPVSRGLVASPDGYRWLVIKRITG